MEIILVTHSSHSYHNMLVLYIDYVQYCRKKFVMYKIFIRAVLK